MFKEAQLEKSQRNSGYTNPSVEREVFAEDLLDFSEIEESLNLEIN